MANMMRHVLRPALLAAVGAGLLGLAGCTGGSPVGGGTSGSTSPGGSGGATSTETPPPGTGSACDLLTPADITAATSQQVGAPVERSASGASVCEYGQVVVTRLRSPVTAAQFSQTVRQVASAVQGQVTPVSGIGQAAAYIPLLKQICVVREPTFFCVAGVERRPAEVLATTAVGRL